MKGRIETWVGLAIVVVGFGAAVVVGLVSITRSRNQALHPDAAQIPSVALSVPDSTWRTAATTSAAAARAALAEQNLPGLSVAVGRGGQLVWVEGFGWADTDRRDKVTPRTRFRIGHVSNTLTSAVVGRLRDQERLHLDDEIQRFVPSFPRQTWPVTIRQLMGHTAGTPHYRDDEWGDKPTEHCTTAGQALALVPHGPLLFEPGTQSRYSTYGWVLVSAAAEAAAREPFFDATRTLVLGPLGMDSTIPDAPRDAMPDRATSYFRGNLGGLITSDVDYSCFVGGGGWLSTPTDLVRFGLAMMSDSLLRPATVATLQAPQTLSSGTTTSFGLGWMLETVELAGQQTPVIGHASRTPEGASTSFLTFPTLGLVVTVSTNVAFADMKSVALAVAEAFSSSSGLSRSGK